MSVGDDDVDCVVDEAAGTIDALVRELLGRKLADKYRLDAELGRGGMGIVFAGEHVVTGRPIAIKVLRPEMSEDASLGRRFVREVKAAAGLVHPNVVSVLDFGVEPDGTAFQVLELLHGESLSDRLGRGCLSPTRALELLLPILHALDAAHARGVVHRDLKPDNVFLSRNAHGRIVPKLLDFGIAKVRQKERPEPRTETHTTQLGTVIGTPAYMSPEQARGSEVGPATDIWAIAVVLYECLAGRVPFDDENASIMMARVMLERAPLLALVAPEVPKPLARAIDAALEPEAARRPPTMGAFALALRDAAKEAGLSVPEPGVSDCADEPVVAENTDEGAERARARAAETTPIRRHEDEPDEDRTGPLGPLREPRQRTDEDRPREAAAAPTVKGPTAKGPTPPPPIESRAPTARVAPTPAPREGYGPGALLAVLGLSLAIGAIGYVVGTSRAPAPSAPEPVPTAAAPDAEPEPVPVEPAPVEPAPIEASSPAPAPEVEAAEIAPPEPAPAAHATERHGRGVRGATIAAEPTTTTTPEPRTDERGDGEHGGDGELPEIRAW